MLAHVPTQTLLLHAPDPFQIRELIPDSKLLSVNGYNLAIKHTVASAKILRNIGVEAPMPINVYYDWPGKYPPMSQQRTMAEFRTMHKQLFDLSEMGTGKTGGSLWAADYLMRTKSVRRALVLCTLSQMSLTWQRDIFDILPHRTSAIVHGSHEKRLEALQSKVDFYILNHDGISLKEMADTIRKRPDIDLVIVDEGGLFRNSGTARYKALTKTIRPDMRLWWLTGTPCPHAPTDVWAQAKLICPSRVPPFFGAFRRKTMVELSKFKWKPVPGAYTIAYDAMQPAIRFKKSECMDLPPVVTEDREAELTSEQKAAYKSMRHEMYMESLAAEAAGKPITAVNAADKLGKLRQILCGAIKRPGTEEYEVLPHGPRTQVLMEAIEGASAKVLVIVPFKGIIRSLEQEISKYYSVGVINGDVSLVKRTQIIEDFKTKADPHLLLCHPKVMSHGLNLVEADTLICYAPFYSNDEYQQMIERFNRKGQTRKMTIIRIAAHPLEWEIYNVIDIKGISQDNILKLYRSVIS